MTPKVGEVYMLDLGYEGKVRPIAKDAIRWAFDL
jgi:hypothetical protein